MASVTRCDVCGKTVANEHSTWLELWKCDSSAMITEKEVGIDLCTRCLRKIEEVLNSGYFKEAD